MNQAVTYLKLRQARSALFFMIGVTTVFLLGFWWVKGWFFGWLADVTGAEVFVGIASVSFLFWISLGVYAFLIGSLLVRWLSIYYEVYTDRIVTHTGLLARNTLEVDIQDFGLIQVKQSVLGRMLRYGTIDFQYRMLGPAGEIGEKFYNIPEPFRVSAQLRSLMGKASKEGLVGGEAAKGSDTVSDARAAAVVVGAKANQATTAIEGEITF